MTLVFKLTTMDSKLPKIIEKKSFYLYIPVMMFFRLLFSYLIVVFVSSFISEDSSAMTSFYCSKIFSSQDIFKQVNLKEKSRDALMKDFEVYFSQKRITNSEFGTQLVHYLFENYFFNKQFKNNYRDFIKDLRKRLNYGHTELTEMPDVAFDFIFSFYQYGQPNLLLENIKNADLNQESIRQFSKDIMKNVLRNDSLSEFDDELLPQTYRSWYHELYHEAHGE